MAEKLMEDLDRILAQLSPEEIERGIQSLKQALLDLDRQNHEMMQRVNEEVFGKDK